MSYLLRGSLAVDEILIHHGHFHARIFPDQIARLNVSFGADEAHDAFGGTAGNIAHNACLLGDAPIVNSSVGSIDGQAHIERLRSMGADVSAIFVAEGEKSAKVILLTDSDNNQISVFQAGALKRFAPLPAALPDLCHLAPESPRNMALAAREILERGGRYFLDPGQALGGLLEGGGEPEMPFERLLWGASGLFVNDYEGAMICEALNMSVAQIAERLPFVVRTLGKDGAELHHEGRARLIPVCAPDQIVDPTGCGDAFRAGFLHAHSRGESLEKCCQLGSVMGSFAIERAGGQEHAPSREAIFARLAAHFPEPAERPRPPRA